MKPIRSILWLSVLAVVAAPTIAAESGPQAVFEKLKAMEGSWVAHAEALDGHEAAPDESGRHDFRVSANGTVVMEIMNPDHPHEMINMYSMDGDDLVLTHYCSSGNQPVMKLDADSLADGRAAFDYVGGANLDPAVDMHIHATTLVFGDDGSVVEDWVGWSDGEPAGTMRFTLSRGE